MKISQQVNEAIKTAMRNQDKIRLEALRAAKTAFTLARTKVNVSAELSNEEELKIIQKLVKQRNESAEIYKQQARNDLYEREIAEAKVLEEYLPARISPDELRKYLEGIIEKTGAADQKDMGRVMGVATKELAGKADGKEIAIIVRELLTG
ncbi:MAG: GatB/YqeY domain-containing protein [Bacteroidales bacterium]|jgi:uncharacterized protein YqeY|nr:GatB/YqeY domain-containing protein [Bacteroidales bacterium]